MIAHEIPKNIRECTLLLKKVLSPEDIEQFKNTEWNKLIRYHFNLGLYIRNHWGLYRDNSSLMKSFEIWNGPDDPDLVSNFILRIMWLELNEIEITEEHVRDLTGPWMGWDIPTPDDIKKFLKG